MTEPLTALPRSHDPMRPTWLCAGCGREWPCDHARQEMRANSTRVGLAIAAWDYLEQATMDGVPGSLREMWGRFIGWTRLS